MFLTSVALRVNSLDGNVLNTDFNIELHNAMIVPSLKLDRNNKLSLQE